MIPPEGNWGGGGKRGIIITGLYDGSWLNDYRKRQVHWAETCSNETSISPIHPKVRGCPDDSNEIVGHSADGDRCSRSSTGKYHHWLRNVYKECQVDLSGVCTEMSR